MVGASTRSFRFLGMAAAMAVVAATSSAQIAPGDLFPSLSAAGLSAESLQKTSGNVVVVDFWASWCATCKASSAAYSRLHRQFAERGLVIVGVSVDTSPSAYSALIAKFNPSFVMARDSQQKLVSTVQMPTMPTCYLVDRNGRVRYIHAGFNGDRTECELLGEIDALLDAKAGSP